MQAVPPEPLHQNFYPRPPRGGRPLTTIRAGVVPTFLSTPSARRATRNFICPKATDAISIHALREEGDYLPAPALQAG